MQKYKFTVTDGGPVFLLIYIEKGWLALSGTSMSCRKTKNVVPLYAYVVDFVSIPVSQCPYT
jgi:hypothetical protein